MRIWHLAGLAALAVIVGAGSAVAQTTIQCTDQGFGNSICHDGVGHVTHHHTDSFGNTTITDQTGRQARVHEDGFGHVVIQGNDGTTIRGQTDLLGNTTFMDQNGRSTRCTPSLPGATLPGQSTTTCR
jgi:hypothetical protein